MPRSARSILPNFPHHVIRRGYNRQVVFAYHDDDQYYLENQWEWKEKLRRQAPWKGQPPINLDEGYLSLGTTPSERVKHYRARVMVAILEGEWEQIREAIQRGP